MAAGGFDAVANPGSRLRGPGPPRPRLLAARPEPVGGTAGGTAGQPATGGARSLATAVGRPGRGTEGRQEVTRGETPLAPFCPFRGGKKSARENRSFAD